MICACGVYYFSAPFDRFIIRSRRRDGSDVGRMRNVPCPSSPLSHSPVSALLLCACFGCGGHVNWERNYFFLLLRHKPGIFVIRQAGLCTSIKLQVTTSCNKSGIWAVTSQPFSPPPSEI